MTASDKLSKALNSVTRELQKQGADRTDPLAEEQIPQDRATKIHRLVVFRRDKESIFTFIEYELLDNYSSNQWKRSCGLTRGNVITYIRIL